MMKRLFKLVLIALVISNIQYSAFSQSEEEPLIEKLRNNFQKEYFSVGILLQTVADFQVERSFPGYNGFNISNFRLKLYGELDKKFGYFLQANFINLPGLLDAKLYYRFSKQLTLDAGMFKAPFSKEFLVSADAIDFVNRSRVVAVLAPGRQIGAQARGRLGETFPVEYNLGIFNGNGYGGNSNDNNDFLYAARLTVLPFKATENSPTRLEISASAVYSRDDLARVSELLNPFVFDALFFSGKRTLYGADFRFTAGKFLLAGEYVKGDFDGNFTLLAADTSIGSAKPDGYYLTAGYMLTSNLQLLGRWDSFKADSGADNPDWAIIGLNFWPSQVSELQLNYVINTDNSEFKYHQVLVNAQIAF
jgi:hypothetical protein